MVFRRINAAASLKADVGLVDAACAQVFRRINAAASLKQGRTLPAVSLMRHVFRRINAAASLKHAEIQLCAHGDQRIPPH